MRKVTLKRLKVAFSGIMNEGFSENLMHSNMYCAERHAYLVPIYLTCYNNIMFPITLSPPTQMMMSIIGV